MTYPIAANGALCDPSQTERYFAMLFRHVDPASRVFSILGIGEKGTPREGTKDQRGFRERKFLPLSSPELAHGHFRRWAEWHTASFVVPAVLDPSCQAAGDVKVDKIAELTSIIADLDQGDVVAVQQFLTTRLGRPTMIVASGGFTDAGQAKRHLYWRLSEPSDEVERVAALRKTLAAKTGGDQSFGRATQVIRVPGTVHAKNGNPSLCAIIDECDADYSLDELAEIIETMEPLPGVQMPAEPFQAQMVGGMLDFSAGAGRSIESVDDALHRDIHEGGTELTRWGEASKVIGFQIAEARRGHITVEQAYLNAEGWMLQHMIPPWPDGRFRQEFEALLSADIKAKGPMPVETAVTATAPAVLDGIAALPFQWRDPATIPPRQWVFGRWFLRNTVTAMIAPGGVGKSSLMAAIMLSLATGRDILGKDVWGGPQRAWYWNLEDDGDELARQFHAVAMFHNILPGSVGERLFINSGPDGQQLCTALEDRGGFRVLRPVSLAIIEQIRHYRIDLLTIDPFVSSHKIDENHNVYIDAITKEWAFVAKETGCAIGLVHHTKKMAGARVGAEAARGASSLTNAARSVLALNRMTAEEGRMFGMERGREARFFSVEDDKHNRAPAEKAAWFQLKSVELGNGDNVGVVTPWSPPSIFEGVTADHLFEIQRVVALGTYRKDPKAQGWVGEVIARILNINIEETPGRARIAKMVTRWVESGHLREYQAPDAQRKMKPHVGGPMLEEPKSGPMNFEPGA